MFLKLLKTKLFILAMLYFLLPSILKAQETINFKQTQRLVLEKNREIKAALLETAAAENDLNQARQLPNPEVEFEIENLGKSATGVMLSQPVGFGGKRHARIEAARAAASLATAELNIRRAAIMAETHRRFYKALGYQSQLEQIDSLLTFAESVRSVIALQAEHGLAAKTELLRSIKDITLLKMERNTFIRQYENSLTALGSLWGSKPGAIRKVSGELHGKNLIYTRDSLAAYLERSPILQAALAQTRNAKAREKESRAERFPGFSIKGGYARDGDIPDIRLILGASIGLPLFNLNSDAVAAAANRTQAAQEKSEAVRNEIQTKLLESFGEIDQMEFKATDLKEKVIPETREVLAEVRRQFEAGKISYVDLITTQRELVDAWRNYLSAETDIQLALANIMELVGHP